MPTYVESLLVPARTPETKPVEKEIEIPRGMVSLWEVYFPPGCHGLVRFAVLYGEIHLFPREKGKWHRGDSETISHEDRWLTPDEPTKLRLVGWSADELYSHELQIRISVLPVEEISFRWLAQEIPRRTVEQMFRAMGWI